MNFIINRIKSNPRLAALTITADILLVTVIVLFVNAVWK